MNIKSNTALRDITLRDWAQFGNGEVAYVRPVMVNGTQAIAIHAADGTPIGAAPDVGLAIAAIVEHEMIPALLH